MDNKNKDLSCSCSWVNGQPASLNEQTFHPILFTCNPSAVNHNVQPQKSVLEHSPTCVALVSGSHQVELFSVHLLLFFECYNSTGQILAVLWPEWLIKADLAPLRVTAEPSLCHYFICAQAMTKGIKCKRSQSCCGKQLSASIDYYYALKLIAAFHSNLHRKTLTLSLVFQVLFLFFYSCHRLRWSVADV